MINYTAIDRCIEKENNRFNLALLVIEKTRDYLNSDVLHDYCKGDEKVIVAIAELAKDKIDYSDLQKQAVSRYTNNNDYKDLADDHDVSEEFNFLKKSEDYCDNNE